MSEFSISDVGVKVGLEIHQQLATNKKLFCNCTPLESDEYFTKFLRKLRASKSELGEFDPAVLFEKSNGIIASTFITPLKGLEPFDDDNDIIIVFVLEVL